ncbi:MAG: hypothetical protein EB103_05015 [Actinobacteria bacterium]|nr:hypothetical protein [Actinomycetota bacterium]
MAQVNRLSRGEVAVGALQVGSNDTVYGIEFGTVEIDPAAINATTRGGTTFTLTGAATTDIIIVNPPSTLNDDLIFCGAAVTAANTVTVYLYNPTAGSINQAAATFSYCWIDTTA